MAKLLVNKYTDKKKIADLKSDFSQDSELNQGEIIIMNNPDSEGGPGIVILDSTGNPIKVGEGSSKGGFNPYDQSLELKESGIGRDLKVKDEGYRVKISNRKPKDVSSKNAENFDNALVLVGLDGETGDATGLSVPVSKEIDNSLTFKNGALYVPPIPDNVEDLGETLVKFQNDIEENKSGISGNTSSIKVIDEKLAKQSSSIETLDDRVSKNETDISGLSENYDSLSSSLDTLDGKIESLKTDFGGRIDENKAAVDGISQITQENSSNIQTNSEDIANLKNSKIETDSNISKNTDEIELIKKKDIAQDSMIESNASSINSVYAELDRKVTSVVLSSKQDKYLTVVHPETLPDGAKQTDVYYDINPVVVSVDDAQEFKPEVKPTEPTADGESGTEGSPEVPEVDGLASALDLKRHIDAINSYTINGNPVKGNPVLSGTDIEIKEIGDQKDTLVNNTDKLSEAIGKQQATINALSTCLAATANNIHQDLYIDKIYTLGPDGIFPGKFYDFGSFPREAVAMNVKEPIPDNSIGYYKGMFTIGPLAEKEQSITLDSLGFQDVLWSTDSPKSLFPKHYYIVNIMVKKTVKEGSPTPEILKLGKITDWEHIL